jgi:hypothetical protein
MKAAIHGVTMLAALLLAACSEPPPVQVLNSRVSARMSPVQPCNRPASAEYLPNGARISIPDTALFTVGRTDLSPCGEYAVASAVEAMLDPRIMQIVIEPGGDINAPDAFLPRERVGSLRALLLNPAFVPAPSPVLVQPAATPSRVWGIVLIIPGNG